MTAEIETYRRVTLDGVGTFEGLLALVNTAPVDVPLNAEIVTTYNYEGCPPEAIEAEGNGEDLEHEHGPRVGFILEWPVDE